MAAKRKAPLTKVTTETIYNDDPHWRVRYGKLKRGRGNPGKTEHLFRVMGEKLPFAALATVKRHMLDNKLPTNGVYVSHDSMGCPRYIGRGDIFGRLRAHWQNHQRQLMYFSFYVVSEKKHEREVETLLIRSAGFLLEFNDRKKQMGIEHGNARDFEAGTLFYERQKRRAKKKAT